MSPKDKQSNEQQQQVQQVQQVQQQQVQQQQQQQQLNEEMAITNLIESIFQEDKEYNAKQNSITTTNSTTTTNTTNSYFTMGLAAAFVIAHGAILFSLPPVILGKGAPFLPTKGKTMDAMFRLIRKQPQIQHKLQKLQKQQQLLALTSSSLKGMTFVDLGSGDGRMVFRSARESNLFHQSFGYEINPVLHIFAKTRRIIQYSNYYKSTNFYRQDLWKLNLKNIDVIAVYGLYPIMDRLGQKMEEEVTDGTIVVSNVFSIPGWKPIVVENGIFIYSIPESLS